MNRRELLRLGSAALIGLGGAGRLYAAPTSGPRFLLVFLRGGYDSTNLLIPYSSSFYYEARPNIARYLASPRRIAFNEAGIFRHYPELDSA